MIASVKRDDYTESLRGTLQILELSGPLNGYARGKVDRDSDRPFRVSDDRGKVSAPDVHVNPSGEATLFALERCRRVGYAHSRDGRQRNLRPRLGDDRQLAQVGQGITKLPGIA
jgi:hypothetical protein